MYRLSPLHPLGHYLALCGVCPLVAHRDLLSGIRPFVARPGSRSPGVAAILGVALGLLAHLLPAHLAVALIFPLCWSLFLHFLTSLHRRLFARDACVLARQFSRCCGCRWRRSTPPRFSHVGLGCAPPVFVWGLRCSLLSRPWYFTYGLLPRLVPSPFGCSLQLPLWNLLVAVCRFCIRSPPRAPFFPSFSRLPCGLFLSSLFFLAFPDSPLLPSLSPLSSPCYGYWLSPSSFPFSFGFLLPFKFRCPILACRIMAHCSYGHYSSPPPLRYTPSSSCRPSVPLAPLSPLLGCSYSLPWWRCSPRLPACLVSSLLTPRRHPPGPCLRFVRFRGSKGAHPTACWMSSTFPPGCFGSIPSPWLTLLYACSLALVRRWFDVRALLSGALRRPGPFGVWFAHLHHFSAAALFASLLLWTAG